MCLQNFTIIIRTIDQSTILHQPTKELWAYGTHKETITIVYGPVQLSGCMQWSLAVKQPQHPLFHCVLFIRLHDK